MCGCFTRHRSWAEIHACLNLIGPAINLQARYNNAPSQEAGVVRAEADVLGLSMLRWGLIPGWARDPAIAYKLINARAERRAARSSSTGWATRLRPSPFSPPPRTPRSRRSITGCRSFCRRARSRLGSPEVNVALDPTPETLLAVYPVSTRVNSPRHDDPECIAPTSLA